jgi:hypothetical protein
MGFEGSVRARLLVDQDINAALAKALSLKSYVHRRDTKAPKGASRLRAPLEA